MPCTINCWADRRVSRQSFDPSFDARQQLCYWDFLRSIVFDGRLLCCHSPYIVLCSIWTNEYYGRALDSSVL